MVLENTALFLDLDQAVHKLEERILEFRNIDFLFVVLSQNAMPVADQIAKRLGVNLIFSAADKIAEPKDSNDLITVVSYDYNRINESGRDMPQDFIYHQEQNLRATLTSIYADTYKKIATKFSEKIVIMVDELTKLGNEFTPSLVRNLNHRLERISLSMQEIPPEAPSSQVATDKRFVFLHACNEDSANEIVQGFDILIENVSAEVK